MERERKQCTAKSKQSGQRCKRPPMKGGTVCASHGGKAPQVRAKARERLEVERAAKAAARFALPVEIGPGEALLQEVHRAAGWVQYLTARLEEVDPERLVWGVTRVETEPGGSIEVTEDGGFEPGPSVKVVETSAAHAVYELLMRERQQLVRVSEAALKAGVEERRVRLAESQGQLVGGLLQRVLGALLDELVSAGIEQSVLRATWDKAVGTIVPRELRALTS